MSNIIDSIQLSGVTYQIQGSGGVKAIEAGRGISITTGETADTVSFNLPISAGTGTNSIIENSPYNKSTNNYAHAEGFFVTANGMYSHAEGYYTTASGTRSHAEGDSTTASGTSSHAEGGYTVANGQSSHAEGDSTTASGKYSHAEGQSTIANNQSEHASGQYNVSSSASTTFGNSGNTLFSVGNGTADNARRNAFEIRQNGDIYLTLDGQDVKLQDQLGGSSITVDTALDSGSTNPVENKAVYNKFDEVEEVTAAGLNALNDKITPTVELTQAQYDALVTAGTVSADTYYIITDAQAGDLTNYYTKSETNTLLGGKADTATTYTKTEVDTALGGKQATLVSGTNIKTINNESILGSGNIDIQGGSDINVVQTTGTSTTDVMSQNAATSNFIYKINLNYKLNGRDTLALQSKDKNLFIPYMTINGEKVLSTNDLSVIETSAITTSISSSSTDAQVPSAKVVYDKFDEVEQVTAAGLNALNDNFGGLKLVKLTQAEYNALATKDSSTLYVIVD